MKTLFNPGYAEANELEELGFKKVGKNVRISKNCTIIGVERISIGNHVRIDGPTTIVVGDAAYVEIGSFVHISGGCHLSAAAPLKLGDFSGLSQGVRIFTGTDDYSGSTLTNPTVPEKYKAVRTSAIELGRHVIIGTGAVVLPGASIGEGTSVGALSLVSRPLPEWQVCVGNPCAPAKPRKKSLLKMESEFLNELENPVYGIEDQ